MELKIGDVVQLTCGGPTMTITDIGGENEVARIKVARFIGEQLWEWSYEPEALKVVTSAEVIALGRMADAAALYNAQHNVAATPAQIETGREMADRIAAHKREPNIPGD